MRAAMESRKDAKYDIRKHKHIQDTRDTHDTGHGWHLFHWNYSDVLRDLQDSLSLCLCLLVENHRSIGRKNWLENRFSRQDAMEGIKGFLHLLQTALDSTRHFARPITHLVSDNELLQDKTGGSSCTRK